MCHFIHMHQLKTKLTGSIPTANSRLEVWPEGSVRHPSFPVKIHDCLLTLHLHVDLRRGLPDVVGGRADVDAGVVTRHRAQLQAQALLVHLARGQRAGLKKY